MKKAFTLAALFLTFGGAFAQEPQHAPTVAQCQADQKLWLAEIERSARDRTPYSATYRQLVDQIDEMDGCKGIDPQNVHAYYNTRSELAEQASIRQLDFIARHGLMHQFLQEDEAGER